MDGERREWIESLADACEGASAALRERDEPRLARLIVDIDALLQRLRAELDGE